MSYEFHIVLDLEFNPVKRENRRFIRDEIVEIGAVKLNPQMEEVGRFSTLVRPELNDYIDPKITELTGIRTEDVLHAPDLATALQIFNDWVGEEYSRVYSWSDNDLRQLCRECNVKDIAFPENVGRWMDLQKVFQRLIGYPRRECMALSYAAKMMEVEFSGADAHRALYDTEITAEILRIVYSEDFIPRQRKARELFVSSNSRSTYSIGSACASALSQLMAELPVA